MSDTLLYFICDICRLGGVCMKICIPVNDHNENCSVSDVFGRCEFFAFYNSDTKEFEYVKNEAKDAPGGAGIKAANIVVSNKADVIIAPRIGEKAMNVLNIAKIETFENKGNDVKENIESYLNHTLSELA